MNGALNALRQSAVELLREYGVEAVTAMEPDSRKTPDGPVAAVSLRQVVCAPTAFRDYLGQRTDPDTGVTEELYGREVELTLSLDLYAPCWGGEGACLDAAALMAEALICRDVGGLSVGEIRTERVEFLERDGLYRLPVSCVCRGRMLVRGGDGA